MFGILVKLVDLAEHCPPMDTDGPQIGAQCP